MFWCEKDLKPMRSVFIICIFHELFENPMVNIILNGEKLKAFSVRAEAIQQGCPLLPLLFNIVLEILARAIRQEKEMKGIKIEREEVKMPMFAGDTILYVENPADSTRKLLELINEYSKIVEYKINTKKYISIN